MRPLRERRYRDALSPSASGPLGLGFGESPGDRCLPAPGSVRGCTLWPAVATRGRCGLKKGYILPPPPPQTANLKAKVEALRQVRLCDHPWFSLEETTQRG